MIWAKLAQGVFNLIKRRPSLRHDDRVRLFIQKPFQLSRFCSKLSEIWFFHNFHSCVLPLYSPRTGRGRVSVQRRNMSIGKTVDHSGPGDGGGDDRGQQRALGPGDGYRFCSTHSTKDSRLGLMRERVRAQLELHDERARQRLRCGARGAGGRRIDAFDVERCAVT